MQGKVEIAGVNTAKLKVLKSSETMELLRRSKAGDRQAREELIEGNLRLVLSVIQRFAGRGESVDDLFQVGCVGLIKAIDNFDIYQPVQLFHLRRAHDRRRDPPLPPGQQRHPGLPLHAGHRLPGACRPGNASWRKTRRSRRWRRSPRSWTFLGRRWSLPWTPSWTRSPCTSRSMSDGGDAICVMDQVSDTKNTDEHWTGAASP